MMEKKEIHVEISGRDELNLSLGLEHGLISTARLWGTGCLELLKRMEEWRPLLKGSLFSVPLPTGHDHASLLLKRLILSAQELWEPPYADDELCHCRTVLAETVREAIIAGAHTPAEVSRKTMASTSCGSCLPDVEAELKYILGN